MKKKSFSTLKILATVKLYLDMSGFGLSFSTLKILATVKQNVRNLSSFRSFSTLKILATVKHYKKHFKRTYVLVPLRF